MAIPITIFSKAGLDFYREVKTQAEFAKKYDLMKWFEFYMKIKSSKFDLGFVEWIDNNEVDEDNPENQAKYKEMSDFSSVYRYFSGVRG